jgi:hypothetical protein
MFISDVRMQHDTRKKKRGTTNTERRTEINKEE